MVALRTAEKLWTLIIYDLMKTRYVMRFSVKEHPVSESN